MITNISVFNLNVHHQLTAYVCIFMLVSFKYLPDATTCFYSELTKRKGRNWCTAFIRVQRKEIYSDKAALSAFRRQLAIKAVFSYLSIIIIVI